MIVHPLEDLAAICGSETPDQLWFYLVATPTLRAFPNDFDAVVAFRTLHRDGPREAVRTAGLLCTDFRWRRCSTTLIGRVEESGILTAAELDELAEAWLWEDRYYWPVPSSWLDQNRKLAGQERRHGSEQLFIERHIWPPLRRWAVRRITTQNPGRSGDVLERITVLDSRDGDAAMAGLLDAAEGFPAEVRDMLVELGCGWPTGSVRLRALQLLAERDPRRAASMASSDPSETVRRRAYRLRRSAGVRDDDAAGRWESIEGLVESIPGQLPLFG